MKELTAEQIKRQDYVDNAIYQLIREINPVDKEIAWDIEMIESGKNKAKQFAVEQSERIKQDYEDVMSPNRNAPSQGHLNIWRGILRSEINKQKSTKDVFNSLQVITDKAASIYNQVVGTSINWGKIEKRKYQLGYEFYDFEEILAIDPSKVEAYASKGYFRTEYFVELGGYSALKVSSLEHAKELAERIKKEIETIQNSINLKELNFYFKELYCQDIPSFDHARYKKTNKGQEE